MSLLPPSGFNLMEITCDGLPIDEARNRVVHEALAAKLRYLFFLDWDVLVQPQTLAQLVELAENNPEFDVFSGVYCSRKPPVGQPWIWREWENGIFWDWTLGDILRDVVGIGMGCCLLRLSLFDRLPEPWFKTVDEFRTFQGALLKIDQTEDIYFCQKCEQHGIRIMVDTRQLCYHMDYEAGIQHGLPTNCLPVRRYLERQKGRQEKAHAGNQA